MPQNPNALYLRISSDDPKIPTEPDFDPNEFADFNPDEFAIAVDPTKNAPPNIVNQPLREEPSLWERYNTPLTTIPSEIGRSAASSIDPIDSRADRGYIRPFLAGAAEGLGDVVSGLTSPSNILPTIAGFGAAKTGISALSKAAKGLYGLTGVHGGQEVIRPDATLAERAFGVAELAGGLAGLTHNYTRPKGKSIPTDLPESFGPDAYAGPQRRSKSRIPTEDAVFQEYRERLARGEDVRSPQSKKLLEQKSELDASRKESKTIVRNGITYEQTGINPDTGLPTYKPIKTSGLESPTERQAGIDAIFGDVSKPKGTSQLPQHLRGAKPRFNMGNKTYQPEFSSDIDKALFIIAQKNASKQDASYLKFVMDHLGIDEATARQLGAETKAKIKAHLSDKEPGVIKIPQLHESINRTTNASGESMASVEAMNRQTSMKSTGRKYVVFDRSGKSKDLIGPEAVDYRARPNETYGILDKEGQFTALDNRGGEVPLKYRDVRFRTETSGNKLPPEPPSPDTFNISPEPMKPSGGDVISPSKGPSNFANLLNVTKTLKSSMDFSAPLRQGLPLIHKKEWWTSMDDMVKAWGSQGAYDNIMKGIIDDPSGYFKPKIDASGKIGKSFAEEMGLDLTDIVHKREEAMLSNMLDKIPGIKRSNRAYTAFLNKLRADTFKSLIDNAKKADPSLGNNQVVAQNLAKFVNNATGRGSLGELEKAADIINGALFAPRLISGNIQRLNPANYIFARNQGARLEYLKSMLAVTTAWTTVAGLAKLAADNGIIKDADISLDPTNSDFGKIKIGNTRMDPSGGLQTYLVALARMTPKFVGKEIGLKTGQFTSPAREGGGPKTSDYGTGYPPKTQWDVGENFLFNKASPPMRFVGELLKRSGYDPFNTSDQVVRLFTPMIIEDMIELAKDDPSMLWMIGPDALGMGLQTFEKDQKETLFGYKEPFPIK